MSHQSVFTPRTTICARLGIKLPSAGLPYIRVTGETSPIRLFERSVTSSGSIWFFDEHFALAAQPSEHPARSCSVDFKPAQPLPRDPVRSMDTTTL